MTATTIDNLLWSYEQASRTESDASVDREREVKA
jgi:hypothetical protein